MDAKPATFPSSPQTSPAACDATKPKPCCVCKEEKSLRDECMLFSKADDPAADCKNLMERYRTCMAGFGYKV